jgi:hypothetical protein
MVPQDSLPAWQMPALQKGAVEMPKHISEKLKEFNETIHYTNPIAGVCVVQRTRISLVTHISRAPCSRSNSTECPSPEEP